MQSTLKSLLFLLLTTVVCSAGAQTRQQVFDEIQKLLNKAVGEKVGSFSGEDKITKQVFTDKMVSCYKKGLSKYGSEWVHRYTNIPWNDFFEHVIYDATSDGKLKVVKLTFKKRFTSEFFTSDKAGADDPSEYSSMELYAKAKDGEEMEKYLKLLYGFKEKKAESPYNAQIRKFSREQTITWLKDKMNEYVEGGQFDRDFKISLDECKMVITYSGLTRKYEEVIPTKIKGISKYGGFEYESKIASIRATTADMIDNGDKTYRAFSSVGISTADEEVVSNIECALKHLATFCGKSSSSSPAATSSSSPVRTTETSTAQWYISAVSENPVTEQKWIRREGFPSSDISAKWKEDFYITDISYSGTDYPWFVLFAKKPYTDQIWRLSSNSADMLEIMTDECTKNTKMKVTSLAFIKDQWVMVATQGTVIGKQVFIQRSYFPEDLIRDYWKQGFYVTSMAAGKDGWIVVMSKGLNYTQQMMEKYSSWSNKKLQEESNRHFNITSLVKDKGTWYVIYTYERDIEKSDYSIQATLTSDSYQDFYKKGLRLYKTIYVPGAGQ
jgi:hypothetical protein